MKYEYKHIRTNHLLTKVELNKEGNSRWELVSVIIVGGEFYQTFKRALLEDAIETTVDGKVVKVIVIDE